ncbi:MAG: hypothetical protein QM796_00820 [Chthoniobacteraceae bacterium]
MDTATALAIPVTDADRPIKAFLNEHQGLFGYGAEALSTARVKRNEVSRTNGMRVVVWEQMLDGIPVFDGLMKACVTKAGELINLGSGFVPNAAGSADLGTANRAAKEQAPPVSASKAIALAAGNVGIGVGETTLEPVEKQIKSADQVRHYRHPLLNEASAQLVWLPIDGTSMRLAWETVLMGKKAGGMYPDGRGRRDGGGDGAAIIDFGYYPGHLPGLQKREPDPAFARLEHAEKHPAAPRLAADGDSLGGGYHRFAQWLDQ